MEKRKRESEEKEFKEPQKPNTEKDEEEVEVWIPAKKRKEMEKEKLREKYQRKRNANKEEKKEEAVAERPISGPRAEKSLMDLTQEELAKFDHSLNPQELLKKEEQEIMDAISTFKPLLSLKERVQEVVYEKPLETSWTPPSWARVLTDKDKEKMRKKRGILVEGEDVPCLLPRFRDMKLPESMLKHFERQGISIPTYIQQQGLPVLLSGRDMIGIAFTGSGKTLVFTVPMVMASLMEEKKMPLVTGEGPVALVIVPSRELAVQIHEVATLLASALESEGHPQLRTALCIGGAKMSEQIRSFRGGVHMVVGTPGRLLHMLNTKCFSLEICRYLVLDEADRLIDLGFEEDIRSIINYFHHQRQTALFSATMPKKIQNFAKSALLRPVLVNVGRAGAASLKVVQHVEWVAPEVKVVSLLKTLEKTPPPVLIFAENKNDVEDIHEYLLLKGVDAVSIHGGKLQEERTEAMQQFRRGQKDVLVATDVAAKGIDFPAIQHVINFDMPKEIENYVHRIGRTGRGSHVGLATTYVNAQCSNTILLDLKHLLMEAKQKVPQFLSSIEEVHQDPVSEVEGIKGCGYCGGLGHRINTCPKLESERMKHFNLRGTGSGGGDY